MRDAIDRYKDAADRGAFQIKVGSEGYPPDLDTRVNGVDVGGKKMRSLRRIPIDPLCGMIRRRRIARDNPTTTPTTRSWVSVFIERYDGGSVLDGIYQSLGLWGSLGLTPNNSSTNGWSFLPIRWPAVTCDHM